MFRTPRLFFQLAISIAAFIFAIEAVILFSSYKAEKARLFELRETLSMDVVRKTGLTFEELHPGILDRADIEARMTQYTTNIVLLIIIISIVVVAGTLLTFYVFAGRPLSRTLDAIRRSSGSEFVHIKESEIPNNEIGELMRSRERSVAEIKLYQSDLEAKLSEAKSQLSQNAKLSTIGELTAGILHDLSAPLTITLGNVEFLRRRLKDDQESMENIAKIHHSTKVIGELCKRMRDFVVKSDARGMFPLAGIVEESVKLAASKIKKNEVIIRTEIKDMNVWGNKSSITQVFINLINNASDAMQNSEKKEVTIRATGDSRNVQVEFSDTGPGIPPEILEKVFDSFFTTKAGSGGTGLGLANCKRILAENDGKISVQSSPGTGTTFLLEFRGTVV